MIRVAAKYIYAIEYSPIKMLLKVWFSEEGAEYLYHDVPEQIWYELRRAVDPDTYFNEKIAGSYTMNKMDSRSC